MRPIGNHLDVARPRTVAPSLAAAIDEKHFMIRSWACTNITVHFFTANVRGKADCIAPGSDSCPEFPVGHVNSRLCDTRNVVLMPLHLSLLWDGKTPVEPRALR